MGALFAAGGPIGWILGLLMKWISPEKIIQGAITAYMKAKDVDLEKFKSANVTTDSMVAHILEASEKFAETKASYAIGVLAWWPFRVILFALLFFPAAHFTLIVLDSMCPVTWDWHMIHGVSMGGCGFLVPKIPDSVNDIYRELLLFFVIAKPADTAIAGALSLTTKYLNKK